MDMFDLFMILHYKALLKCFAGLFDGSGPYTHGAVAKPE
jgi:hypothetical protein